MVRYGMSMDDHSTMIAPILQKILTNPPQILRLLFGQVHAGAHTCMNEQVVANLHPIG